MGVEDPAETLASAVDAAVGAWVERSVARIMEAYTGAVPAEVAEAARQAGEHATMAVGEELKISGDGIGAARETRGERGKTSAYDAPEPIA